MERFSSIIPFLHQKNFEYQPLSLERREIRLLRVLPKAQLGKKDQASIRGELFHVSLDDMPIYNALSYAWGAATDSKYRILIDAQPFRVRKNLWLALKELQPETEELVIWIDAICINQGDTQERNHQVGYMRAIYKNARKVWVWLGPQAMNSDLAIQQINDLLDCGNSNKKTDDLFSEPTIVQQIDALAWLFCRDYWRRLWIIQEICLAKNITIFCGHVQTTWEAMCTCLDIFTRQDFKTILDTKFGLGDWRYKTLLFQGPNNVYTARQRLHLRMGVFDHLTLHVSFASDPRDMIYGLLGLVEPKDTLNIVVDYSLPVAKVYTDFAQREIEASKSLVILTRAEMRGEALAIFRLGSQTGRNQNGSILGLVLTESEGIRIGHLDAITKSTNVRSETDWKNGVDKIHSWFQFLRTSNLEDHIVFAKTVSTADILATIDVETENNFRALLGSLASQYTALHKKPATDDLSQYIPCEFDVSPKRIEGESWFFRAVVATWDREFFISSQGDIGLAPKTALEGDIICVPLGCPVPMIFRRVQDHYVVIGEAYVHSFMNGKALELLDQGKVELEEFELH